MRNLSKLNLGLGIVSPFSDREPLWAPLASLPLSSSLSSRFPSFSLFFPLSFFLPNFSFTTSGIDTR